MKKVLLFLCIIGVAVMMTSCRRDNPYIEQKFVYISESRDVTPNITYGRAFIGFNTRLITSPQIQAGHITVGGQPISFEPGRFYLFTYIWEEANGRTSLGKNRGYADNVNIVIEHGILEVKPAFLDFNPAPPYIPEEYFVAFNGSPLFFHDATSWGDNWIVGFDYMGGAEMPSVTFHKRAASEDNTYSSDTEIDVRISGIQQVPQPLRRGFPLALNMAELREKLQEEVSQDVRIRFHYYVATTEGQTQVITPRATPWITWRLAGAAQQ